MTWTKKIWHRHWWTVPENSVADNIKVSNKCSHRYFWKHKEECCPKHSYWIMVYEVPTIIQICQGPEAVCVSVLWQPSQSLTIRGRVGVVHPPYRPNYCRNDTANLDISNHGTWFSGWFSFTEIQNHNKFCLIVRRNITWNSNGGQLISES